MISRNKSLLAVLAGLVASAQLVFGIINSPVPTNAYITIGGLDWAWASPMPYSSESMDLTYQAPFGWHIPTAAELAVAPLATAFLVPWGNVPYGQVADGWVDSGTDPVSGAYFEATNAAYVSAHSAGAVAVPYFSTYYVWADWQDGLGQTYGPWAGMDGAESFADQLVVRESGAGAPETTSTLGLLGLALGAVAMLRRRFCR